MSACKLLCMAAAELSQSESQPSCGCYCCQAHLRFCEKQCCMPGVKHYSA